MQINHVSTNDKWMRLEVRKWCNNSNICEEKNILTFALQICQKKKNCTSKAKNDKNLKRDDYLEYIK